MERTSNATTAQTTTTTTTVTTTASGSSSSSSSTSLFLSSVPSVMSIASRFLSSNSESGGEEAIELRILRRDLDEPGSGRGSSFSRAQISEGFEVEGEAPPPYETVQSAGFREPYSPDVEERLLSALPSYSEVVLMGGGEHNPFNAPPVRNSARRSRLITTCCSWDPFKGCGALITILCIVSWAIALFCLFIQVLQCSSSGPSSSSGFASCPLAQQVLAWMAVAVILFSIGYFCFESQINSFKKRLWQSMYGTAHFIACCTLLIAYGLVESASSSNIMQNTTNVSVDESAFRVALVPVVIWVCILFLLVCRSYVRVLDVARR